MKRSIAISILLAVAILNLGCDSEKSSEEKITWGRADAKEINLTSKIPGRVVKLNVAEGARVNRGDIIAQIDETIVFVEVKTRSTNRFGNPAESVTIKKQQKIFTAAEIFLQQNDLDKSCRFDVIEVFARRNGFSANHIVDAFAL